MPISVLARRMSGISWMDRRRTNYYANARCWVHWVWHLFDL